MSEIISYFSNIRNKVCVETRRECHAFIYVYFFGTWICQPFCCTLQDPWEFLVPGYVESAVTLRGLNFSSNFDFDVLHAGDLLKYL